MTPQQLQADQLGEIRNLWLSLTAHQRAALVAVCRHIGKLGPMACEILTDSAKRYGVGAELGDFDDDRDWIEQGLEEAIDNNAYLLRELKRIQRAQRRMAAPKSSPKAAE